MRVGATLPQARAACHALSAFEHDPHADARALLAIARWLVRFTPIVELAGNTTQNPPSRSPQKSRLRLTAHAAHPRNQLRATPHGNESHTASHSRIWLDLTGSAHLFGGPAKTLRLIHQAFIRFQLHAVIASATNPAAAFARTWQHTASASESLDQLPVIALDLPSQLLATLDHLGVHTVGLLRKLPRDKLPARLGTAVLHRLDQLDGKIPQPLTPVQPFAPVRVRRHWDFAVVEFPRLAPVLDELLDKLCRQLQKQCRGATLARLTLERAYESPIHRELRFARPTHNVSHFKRLIDVSTEQLALETTRKAGRRRTVHSADELVVPAGFIAMEIQVLATQVVIHDQSMLVATGAHDEKELSRQLDTLVETLVARLGPAAVTRATPAQSYLPELAWHEENAVETANTANTTTALDSQALPWLDAPLWLHPPVEVKAVVTPSHDRDGKPVQITWPDGSVTPIPHAVGPIRLGGQWWRDHNKTRDYFHLIDHKGKYHFAFRVLESGRWFVQGS